MSLDDLQKTWQSQDSGPQPRVDADLLLKQVQRNHRDFKATIFWRDFREVGVAVFLAGFFLVRGLSPFHWTAVLMAVPCIWVGGFILVDRLIQRRRRATQDDSLLGWVEASLRDVEHQIWLLKNVLWWYLLPLGAGLAIFILDDAIEVVREGHDRGLFLVGYAAFCVALFAGVYWLNQFAVRRNLEPRRQELRAIRESLAGDGE